MNSHTGLRLLQLLGLPFVLQCESYRPLEHVYRHLVEQAMRYASPGQCCPCVHMLDRGQRQSGKMHLVSLVSECLYSSHNLPISLSSDPIAWRPIVPLLPFAPSPLCPVVFLDEYKVFVENRFRQVKAYQRQLQQLQQQQQPGPGTPDRDRDRDRDREREAQSRAMLAGLGHELDSSAWTPEMLPFDIR